MSGEMEERMGNRDENGLLQGLESSDSWISVSAAEGLGRQRQHAALSGPRLAAAVATAGRSSALRSVALTALVAVAPNDAVAPAANI